MCFLACTQQILQIHLWCDTCRPLDSQHGSQLRSLHVLQRCFGALRCEVKRCLNKKVLLRECKRHTARRVVNTPSVVLTGYPPILTWLGGYPFRVPPHQGTPRQGTPPTRVSPPPEYLPRLDLAEYPPPPAGPSRVPPPPPASCPMAFWEMLQSIMGYGYPPSCGQTNKVKLLPSRRTTYAGGKNCMSLNWILNV